MKIAITINDVIRNFSETFKQVYEVFQEEEESFTQSLEENDYDFKVLDDDGNESDVAFFDKKEKNILDLHGKDDPIYLTKHFEFENKEAFLSFLYSQMAFEIFAKTSLAYKNAMKDLELIQYRAENNGFDLTLLSMERDNSKPATLFFLSREKCKANKIHFVDTYEDIWEDYDVIITADTYIAEIKPKRKKVILVEKEYNKDFKTKHKIKLLSEIDEKWKIINN